MSRRIQAACFFFSLFAHPFLTADRVEGQEPGAHDAESCPEELAADPHYARPLSNEPKLLDVEGSLRIVRVSYRGLRSNPNLSSARVWILINTAGRVIDVNLSRSSGDVQVDSAAIRAIRAFKFEPASYLDDLVCSWLNVPIPAPHAVGGPSLH